MQGNVSVTVGHSLAADLNNSDDWNQCCDKKKPAHRKVASAVKVQHRHRDRYQDNCRCDDVGPGQGVPRVGVIGGQLGGPKRLPNVGNVGHDGVSQAQGKRLICDSTARTLRDHGYGGTRCAHQ